MRADPAALAMSLPSSTPPAAHDPATALPVADASPTIASPATPGAMPPCGGAPNCSANTIHPCGSVRISVSD